jgi:polyisoprenoid-binding protein YceI
MRPIAAGLGIGLAAAVLAVPTLLGQAGTPPPAGEARWIVDIVHSQIDFRVRHLVGRVRGTFTNWYAELHTQGDDWTRGTVSVNVQTTSLNTGNRLRDDDLRSSHFFAVDSFPVMGFKSTGIETSDSAVVIHGMLTIKERSRPVTLRGQYRGVAKDMEGHERIAFDATTTIDRRDFGMSWTPIVGDAAVIGNDVEITIALEAVRVH